MQGPEAATRRPEPIGEGYGRESRESVRRRARAPACRPISVNSAAAWTAVSSAPGFFSAGEAAVGGGVDAVVGGCAERRPAGAGEGAVLAARAVVLAALAARALGLDAFVARALVLDCFAVRALVLDALVNRALVLDALVARALPAELLPPFVLVRAVGRAFDTRASVAPAATCSPAGTPSGAAGPTAWGRLSLRRWGRLCGSEAMTPRFG
jgi:hypothetical protein